jgi:hypothetical protein
MERNRCARSRRAISYGLKRAHECYAIKDILIVALVIHCTVAMEWLHLFGALSRFISMLDILVYTLSIGTMRNE